MPDSSNQADLLRFLPRPRIVAVDNREEELKLIWKALFRLGLPCLPMEYDEQDGLKKPDLWKSERLRIIFLDLNLTDIESPPSASRLVGPIAEVLAGLAPEGPYLLIFWTKHPSLVKETLKLLPKRRPSVPLPAAYTLIDKQPFLPIDGEHDLVQLQASLTEALSKNALLLGPLAWESEAEGAAVKTINGIHGLVAVPQLDGTAQKDKDLRNVLKTLAASAWGKQNAKDNPGASVTSGLAHLLLDHIDYTQIDHGYTDVWRGALTGGWNSSLPSMAPPAKLNSQCLLDLNCKIQECRGAWLEFTPKALRSRTIFRDWLGSTRRGLAEEFINPPGRGAGRILKMVKLGLLECTAVCDYNNNKAPLRRYILCSRIPINLGQYIKWEDPSRDTKHNAIYRMKTVFIDHDEFHLFLNFRYAISLPAGHNLLKSEMAEAIFRVRSKVLADITARFAAHTTRPGILDF